MVKLPGISKGEMYLNRTTPLSEKPTVVFVLGGPGSGKGWLQIKFKDSKKGLRIIVFMIISSNQ